MPEVSDIAPDFDLPQVGGNIVNLGGLRGGSVVLFFYPRDDTPGCIKEAIGFSEVLQSFANQGVNVFGISNDSLASHERFVAKHRLSVPLLSAENTGTCQDYGVWQQKNTFGKTYMGIVRTTFLIDATGRIAKIWHKVKVPGHVTQVLAAVQNL